MLARHAENMFWAGRYLERAEDTARMMQATFRSAVSAGPEVGSERYRKLLLTLRLEAPEGQITAAGLLQRLVLDPARPGSIVTAVGSARENLRSLREQIPSELWEHTNRLHLRLRSPGVAAELERDPNQVLDDVKIRCQTLAGIIGTSMARDEGHQFLNLGITIERALMTCRLVHVRFSELSASSYDETALTLRSASALEAYQRAYQASADPVDVARFLLVSNRFPRALLFCLRSVEDQLAAVTAPLGSTPASRMVGMLRSQLEFSDFDALVADLDAALDSIEEGIRSAAQAVAAQFFRDAAEVFDLHTQLLVPGGSE